MKMKLLFAFALFLSVSTSNAQFGLDKLKNKAKGSTSPGETKDASKESTPKENTSKTDKSNAENSPAAKSIRKLRNDFSFAEDAIDKGRNDADYRVSNLEKLLAQIKTEDPNWAEYDKDEAEVKRLKAKYEKVNEKQVMKRRLEEASSAANSIKENPKKASDEWYAKRAGKANYEEVKAYYSSHPAEASDYTKGTLTSMDNFYATEVPKIKQSVLLDIEEYKKYTDYLKDSRAKADYLKDKGWGGLKPETHLDKINEGIKFVDGALLFLTGDAEVTANQKLLNERKADVEKYITGEDYKKDIAKRKQMDIDEVLIAKPEMNDPSLEALVKREFNTKTWGTIKRISIIDKAWTIKKNSLGVPLEKFVDVEIGTSAPDGCQRVSARLICTYEGGGKYGKPFYNEQTATEMNCSNMSKNGTK